MPRSPTPLRIYLAVFAALWIVALTAVFVQGYLLHKPYPYNTLLFYPNIHFTDFTIFDARFAGWDHTAKFFTMPGFPFTYPAPLLACFLAYWTLTPHPLAAYLATVNLFALIAAAVLGTRRPALRLPVVLTLFGSYPLMFLLDRANIEGLVWIPLALGVLAFARRHYTTAAILIGIATGMKIFPGALLLLFLPKKQYRNFATGIAAAAVANIGALALAGPDILTAARGVLSGMAFFRNFEILTYRADQIGFEHSLFSCLKQVLHLVFHSARRTDDLLPLLYIPYAAVAGLAFAILYHTRLRKLPILNQLFALTACSIVLPFISYDYTLVHMYIPWAAFLIFLTTDTGRLSTAKALVFLIPCAILFAPLSWMLVQSAGAGGQIKAIALLAIIAAAAAIPLPSSLFGELTASQPEILVLNRLVNLEKKPAHSLS